MRRLLRRTRVRLTLVYTVVVLLVAGGGATVYWAVFGRVELGGIDSTLLRGQGRLLASGVVPRDGVLHFQDPATLRTATAGSNVTAAILRSSGEVVDESVPAPPLAVLQAAAAAPSDGSALITTVATPEGSSRLVARRVQLAGTPPGILVLSASLAAYDDTLRNTALFLTVAAGMITVLAGLSAYWLSGRALRPVGEITALAGEMSERTLDQRIGLDLPDDEIGDLAATVNGMLARLETAFTTLRQFTADAAHELRTPLAVVMTQAEVALQRSRDASEYRATLEVVLAETRRLSTLADRLLTLARADAGALRPHLEVVELADVLEDFVDRWQPVAADRGVHLVTALPPSGDASVDLEMLRRLVDNLVDNALRHAPGGGVVRVTAQVEGDTWTLAVEDSGAGVPAELRGRLFERFARADPSRTRGTGGAGLGLALCAVVAELHGGDIRLDPERPSRFVVELPRGVAP